MAQRIYTASDQLLVSNLHSVLEKAGISVVTQKSVADTPAGESGPPPWRFDLWVMKDREMARARLLVDGVLAGELPAGPYRARVATPFSPPAEIA